MLRKLLKYDFKEGGRLLLPLLGAVLLLSIIGKFFLETRLYDAVPEFLSGIALFTYIVIIIACAVGVPIYFIIIFYKSFYSNRGYVTHTLPVTTNQKLISKIVTSFLYEILAFIVCVASVFILVYEKDMFSNFIQNYPTINTQFKAAMGMDFAAFWLFTGVLMLVSTFAQMLMFFASVSLGQLFKGHKILGVIVGYFILSMVNQVLSTIVLIVTGFMDVANEAVMTSEGIIAIYGVSGCLTLLEAAGFYIICYIFMEKKLNLN